MHKEKMRNFVEISGNNYEVGKLIGQWWGDYFEEQINKNNQGINKSYLSWLIEDMSDYYKELYDNTERNFPDLIEEIEGMAKGINNSKLQLKKKVTPKQVFVRSLWEGKRSCTSAIFRKKNGYLLCHNLEDDSPPGCADGIFPLCFSKVKLHSNNYERSFISISYPFSLLGTVGINQYLAYQGNTIGDKGKTTTQSWHKRIPSSVFQRKLLEMTSKEEIEEFLNKYYITIPGHNYIVFHDKAYSLEIRPTTIREKPEQQYKLIPREDDFHIHTNYFRYQDYHVDNNWLYPHEKINESISDWRFDKLTEFTGKYSNKDTEDQEIMEFFTSLAKVNYKYTSASLFFDISGEKKICSGSFYFDATQNFRIHLN